MAKTEVDVSSSVLHESLVIGWIVLSIRFVQGWIFWGGGSRRFIYAPSKLDPHAHVWMANKLQSGMPGAILGMQSVLSFLLQHFYLLYASIIIFSLVELIAGMALIAGCFTRFAGFVTALISLTLMLIFGWQGATCMDEWTMAVSNLAIGLTLTLAGSPVCSIDSFLLRRYPRLTRSAWFTYLASGPWPLKRLRVWGFVFAIFTIAFTLLTYNYYRGAIFSPYHPGPVSGADHSIKLSAGQLSANGSVVFAAYVNAGTPAEPSNIIRIELIAQNGSLMEVWTAKDLSSLPANTIKNEYAYNQITTGPNGLVAPVSAKAVIMLPPEQPNLQLQKGNYQLQLYTINGHRFDLVLTNA